jgi:hypothetical protein
MPTREKLESALRNAHAAGDVDAAKKLANALKSASAVEPQPEPTRPQSVLPAPAVEFASAINRGITQAADFFTTDAVNAVSNVVGSDFRVPRLTDAMQSLGGGVPGSMEPGVARQVVQSAGEMAPAAIGLVAGLKGIPSVFSRQSPVRQAIEDLAGKGNQSATALIGKARIRAGDAEMAGKTISDAGRIVNDKLAKNAIKQGFDEGVVAAIKASTSETRRDMSKMVGILESGKKNTLYSVRNRPSDVVGDAITKRLVEVRKINAKAGMQINQEARRLKGQQVDISAAKNAFMDALDDLKVTVDDAGELVFKGSNLEGTSSPRTLKLIHDRLNKFSGDALDAHHLKQFISEHVEFGKKAQTAGLSGKAERAAKALRKEINESLGNVSEGYRTQNAIYSDTIDVLKSFEKSAGQSLDLLKPNADKAIGTAARKLMSNQQSRVSMLNAVDDLDRLVGTHGTKMNDDILALALFADELDVVFKPIARTSLAGDVAKSVSPVKEVPTTAYQAASKVAEIGLDKIRNVNEAEALRSIRELLSR